MGSKFFTTHKVDTGITAIQGLGHELCYLVEGERQALLIDTLSGAGNLRAFCRELTDLPIRVVNTHGHVDHCGGNYDFGEFYLHPADLELMFSHTAPEFRKRFVDSARPAVHYTQADFTPAGPVIPHPVWDGDIFDLGGRQLEVIGVPGHSYGSIVLLERERRIVFSGDACNCNTLLCLPGCTSVAEYLESLEHFEGFCSAFDNLYGGHGLTAVPASIIRDGIALCKEILEGRDEAVPGTHRDWACLYGKKQGPHGPVDGSLCNIAYTQETVRKTSAPRVIR